jgi:predicted GIY-YIG superfamily endonuclease
MNQALMESLRQVALSNVKASNEFKNIGRTYNNNGSKFFTYTLQLQNDKIYVGDSDNIFQRLLAHFEMSDSSSKWIKQHGPVKRILEITYDAPVGAEKERFMEYASIFGFPNVRGSWWCRVDQNPPFMLDEFVRGQMSHNFMSRSEIRKIEKDIREIVAERVVV